MVPWIEMTLPWAGAGLEDLLWSLPALSFRLLRKKWYPDQNAPVEKGMICGSHAKISPWDVERRDVGMVMQPS